MKQDTKERLSSRRFIVVIFCLLVGTTWGSVSLITEYSPAWLAGVLIVIFGIPVSWMTITSLKKPTEVK